MADHHRPIALSTPQDLLHLRSQLHEVAQTLLDRNLPPSDTLRPLVASSVTSYIDHLLSLAALNVSINGNPVPHMTGGATSGGEGEGEGEGGVTRSADASSVAVDWEALGRAKEEFELFDSKMAIDLREMFGKVERALVENTEARKRVPGVWRERLQNGVGALGEVGVEEEDVEMQGAGEGKGLEGIEVGEGVKEDMESVKRGLGEAEEGVPVVAARLKKAREAVAVVVGRE